MKMSTSGCHPGATEAGGQKAPQCFPIQGPHCNKGLSFNLRSSQQYCIQSDSSLPAGLSAAAQEVDLNAVTDLFFFFVMSKMVHM